MHPVSGVTLEQGPNELSNNSLLTVDDIGEAERALYCTSDRKFCCLNDSYADRDYWFLPNGSQVESLPTNDSGTLVVSLGYQMVGLNCVNYSSSDEIPAGVYHCEMMDKNNITHYLYINWHLP